MSGLPKSPSVSSESTPSSAKSKRRGLLKGFKDGIKTKWQTVRQDSSSSTKQENATNGAMDHDESLKSVNGGVSGGGVSDSGRVSGGASGGVISDEESVTSSDILPGDTTFSTSHSSEELEPLVFKRYVSTASVTAYTVHGVSD